MEKSMLSFVQCIENNPTSARYGFTQKVKSQALLCNAIALTEHVLLPLQRSIGHFNIQKGYICEQLATSVNCSVLSPHRKCQAVHITMSPSKYQRAIDFISINISFDQFTIVNCDGHICHLHVSFTPLRRNIIKYVYI